MMNFKLDFKGVVKLLLVLAFLGGLIFIVLSVTTVPKTPATVEQVNEVLVSQGYEPQDITERYADEDPSLIKCIAIQKDDIHFEFFSFDDPKRAVNAYGEFHSLIYRTKYSPKRVEIGSKKANYVIYQLESKGEYSVAIYVGTTAVYAHCKEENAKEINKILDAINYLN
jgi:hypothetical protein